MKEIISYIFKVEIVALAFALFVVFVLFISAYFPEIGQALDNFYGATEDTVQKYPTWLDFIKAFGIMQLISFLIVFTVEKNEVKE